MLCCFIPLHLRNMISMRQATSLVIMFLTLTNSLAHDTTPDELLALLRAGNTKLLQAEQSLTNYNCKLKISFLSFDAKAGKTNSKETNKNFRIYKKNGKILINVVKTVYNSGSQVKSDEFVGALTQKCMFLISRQDQKSDWMLAQFGNKDSEKTFWESFAEHDLVFHPLVAVDQHRMIEKHLTNPSFRLSSVQTRPDGRIEADYTVEWQKELSKDINFTQKGTIVVDPKFNFAILEISCVHSMKFPGGNTSEKPILLRRILDESGSCKSIQYKYGKDPKRGIEDISLEFVDNSFEPVAEEIFNLEYYKVPQPTDIDVQPIPFYYTTIFWTCTCIGCILFAIIFNRLARRRGH